MESIRKIIFYKDHFFKFYKAQTVKVQNKIDEVLFAITFLDRIPAKILEHMTGTNGLYEIKIELGGNIFRIFCCFDKGNLIVLFNAFQKKTQKTPKNEIEKAERLQEEYFKTKKENEKRK